MDRQTLRDWVHRYNADGIDGLVDRKAPGPRPRLTAGQQAELARIVEQGPDVADDGIVRWRRVDLRDLIAARFGVALHERTVGKVLDRLNFSHMSVRPRHPKADAAVQETFKKTSPTSSTTLCRMPPSEADRDLVPGRSQDWPERKPDPDLGATRDTPHRATRSALQMGLSLRRRLSRARLCRRFGSAVRQYQGDDGAS